MYSGALDLAGLYMVALNLLGKIQMDPTVIPKTSFALISGYAPIFMFSVCLSDVIYQLYRVHSRCRRIYPETQNLIYLHSITYMVTYIYILGRCHSTFN